MGYEGNFRRTCFIGFSVVQPSCLEKAEVPMGWFSAETMDSVEQRPRPWLVVYHRYTSPAIGIISTYVAFISNHDAKLHCSFSSHFTTANQFGAMESSRCDASKVLSSILRREASSHGLAMDEDGWVKVSDLISSDTVQLRLGLKSKLLMLDFKRGPPKKKQKKEGWTGRNKHAVLDRHGEMCIMWRCSEFHK